MTGHLVYNASVNLYMDDIANLSTEDLVVRDWPKNCRECQTLMDFEHEGNKIVADINWHPKGDIILACYAGSNEQSRALMWSLSDALHPLAIFTSEHAICVATFSDDDVVVVGGSATGQIVVWNIANLATAPHSLDPAVTSDAPFGRIRDIRWMPVNWRIGPEGKIGDVASASRYLASISQDAVAFWELRSVPSRDPRRRVDVALRLAYHLALASSSLCSFCVSVQVSTKLVFVHRRP